MSKPSVSELINLLNKPALLKWANDIGLKGIRLDQYQKQSKKSGISLHIQIENFVKKGMNFEDEQTQINFNNFIYNKDIIDLEQNIENDIFRGRYDAKIKIGDDIYICDFKSSNGVYFENLLQLSAYQMCNKGCKVAIIQIPEFVFKPVDIDFTKYQEILKALSIIYKTKQEL